MSYKVLVSAPPILPHLEEYYELCLSKGVELFKPDFEVGETVRVTTGPFADFNGIIEEINLDQSKVTVLVNIFGRETPVELGFTDIVKN